MTLVYSTPVLEQSLEERNLIHLPSKDAGDCFMISIQTWLMNYRNVYKTPKQIRQELVDFILASDSIQEFIANMGIDNLDKELRSLKRSGCYKIDLFDLIPPIAAAYFGVTFHIYPWSMNESEGIMERDLEIYSSPIGAASSDIVRLVYINDVHYEPLIPIAEFVPEQWDLLESERAIANTDSKKKTKK